MIRATDDMKPVAPLAGAWIETPDCGSERPGAAVAPLAGAWIETLRNSSIWPSVNVAPLAGAWIETIAKVQKNAAAGSHPSRVRGLKRS